MLEPREHGQPSHIFIVGLSRTGTSLARAVLNASPHIGIAGGESHFFAEQPRLAAAPVAFRERFAQAGDLRTDAGREGVLDALYALPGTGFWPRVAQSMPRDELERRLRETDGSDRAFFDLAMEALSGGKAVRGEKTPQHLRAVPTLLSWFPDARVVHTMRDPRSVYVSLRRKERDWVEAGHRHGWAGRMVRRLGPLSDAYIATKLIREFRGAVALHHRYRSAYGDRYFLLQFERLVLEPEATVRELSAFAGVAFTPEMLEQVVRNSSFAAAGSSGFDRSAVERWRGHLNPLARRWFVFGGGRQMAEFGYRP